MIYHYTSDYGFKGIVLNRTFRYTRSTQSNDKKDSVHIYDLLSKHRVKILEMFEGDISIPLNHILRHVSMQEEEWYKEENERFAKAFVLCFTGLFDKRALWQEYTGYEGYCIGFDEKGLSGICKSTSFQEQLKKKALEQVLNDVVYDENKQVGLIKDVIYEEYKKFIDNDSKELSAEVSPIIYNPSIKFIYDESDESHVIKLKPLKIGIYQKSVDVYRMIAEKIVNYGPFLKNSTWDDEKEIRWCFYRPLKSEGLSSTDKDHKDRDIIEFTFERMPIKEIIIGPNNPITIKELKTRMKNEGYNLNEVEIRKSVSTGVIRERGK